jgi:hypothetical protein
MQNVNQIFYLMFAVFALGIALNAYIDFRKQNIRSVIKVYWIIAMTLIVISSLSYAIGSFGLPLFLFFGSTFLIASLLTVGYLLRSITRTLTRQWISVSACLILALIAFLGYLLAIQAPYLYRLLTVAFILLALTVWQIWEIQQTKKVDTSIHLRFIQYLLFGLIVLIVFRILTATDPQYDGVNYLV